MELSDIRQGRNGDCFILSSIISILHTFGNDFITKIVENEFDNNYIFNHYSITENVTQKDKIKFTYPDNTINLSSKSRDWVQKIETAYIKKFFNGNVTQVLDKGGIAKDVLSRLTGLDTKIIINRILDNKEKLCYDICKERIKNPEWSNDFIKYLDILSGYKVTIFKNKIWELINSHNKIIPEKYYKVKNPCVIGTNGHFQNLLIPGIINEHLYSVLGYKIDQFNNKFLYVYNPHHNRDARVTHYNGRSFITEIKKGRKSIWSFDEIILFISDFTCIVTDK